MQSGFEIQIVQQVEFGIDRNHGFAFGLAWWAFVCQLAAKEF
jgi:hypothetical protein